MADRIGIEVSDSSIKMKHLLGFLWRYLNLVWYRVKRVVKFKQTYAYQLEYDQQFYFI